MTLANFSDANRYLDNTKVSFIDNSDAASEARIADRYIKAFLWSSFGATVNNWDIAPGGAPFESTPEIVVEIAAMIMAAWRYAKLYSMETPDEFVGYPKYLMDEANRLLGALQDGTIGMDDKAYITAGAFSRIFFWPNDLTVDPNDSTMPDRLFSIDQEF